MTDELFATVSNLIANRRKEHQAKVAAAKEDYASTILWPNDGPGAAERFIATLDLLHVAEQVPIATAAAEHRSPDGITDDLPVADSKSVFQATT